MKTFPLGPIMAVLALILGLLAMLDVVKGDVALGMGMIFLSLAILLPGVFNLAGESPGVSRRV